MPLRFCANLSFMFQETTSLLDRYVYASKAGFRGIECAFPYNYTVQEVVDAKAKANVKQVLINVFVGDVSKGELGFAAIPGKENDFMRSLKLAMKYAKALDCSLIHIMSGLVPNPTEENHRLYEQNLRYAVSEFERENFVGVIEPINGYSVPNYYMNSYSRGLNVIKKINSPNLKLMMDLFHLQHLRGNLTNNIKDLLPFVGHIQIAQVPGRNEPDTAGEVDYRYVLSVLEKEQYKGWIGLEYKPVRDTVVGLKWLHEFGYQL